MVVTALLPPRRLPYEAAWLRRMRGADVTVVADREKELGLKRHPVFGRIFTSSTMWATYRDADRLIERSDVVVSVEVYSSLTDQLMRAKPPSARHVVIVWELLANHPIYAIPRYRRVVERVRASDAIVVAVTERARDHLVELGFARERVAVVSPGVDLREHDARRAGGDGGAEPRPLFVGQLTEHKGFRDAVDAVSGTARATGRPLALSVAGDGPQRSYAAGRSDVRFLGYLDRARLLDAYAASSVVLTPSKERRRFGLPKDAEQFCYATVDALAAGKPVIATDAGALAEVVGDPRQIVRQGDVPAMAALLERIIGDRAFAHELGRANLERARSAFDIDVQAEALRRTILGR